MSTAPIFDISVVSDGITKLLATFRLPTVSEEFVPRMNEGGFEEALPVVLEVLESEADDRQERRVNRLMRRSKLPSGKIFATFDETRLPLQLMQSVRELARGEFLDQSVNILAFGLPGTGKSHVISAIGHALVEAGRSVLFTSTFRLVQQLLAAKRDLELPKALSKLDSFELLILDDLGYVQQREEEIEVLFTLMAERYERRSMAITTNLMFSEWGKIFKNPMTTAAAIDRLVHHSTILEFDVASYRTDKGAQAKEKGARKQKGKRK